MVNILSFQHLKCFFVIYKSKLQISGLEVLVAQNKSPGDVSLYSGKLELTFVIHFIDQMII